MLKTDTYNYQYGDLKYYYQIHCRRQQADGNIPLGYDQFIKRLKKMNLHDAIYSPRKAPAGPKRESKTPIQDNIRRTDKLKEQNIQILDFDELLKVESKYEQKEQPKQKLLSRFISFIKR